LNRLIEANPERFSLVVAVVHGTNEIVPFPVLSPGERAGTFIAPFSMTGNERGWFFDSDQIERIFTYRDLGPMIGLDWFAWCDVAGYVVHLTELIYRP
jgi:hypothetical protein